MRQFSGSISDDIQQRPPSTFLENFKYNRDEDGLLFPSSNSYEGNFEDADQLEGGSNENKTYYSQPENENARLTTRADKKSPTADHDNVSLEGQEKTGLMTEHFPKRKILFRSVSASIQLQGIKKISGRYERQSNADDQCDNYMHEIATKKSSFVKYRHHREARPKKRLRKGQPVPVQVMFERNRRKTSEGSYERNEDNDKNFHTSTTSVFRSYSEGFHVRDSHGGDKKKSFFKKKAHVKLKSEKVRQSTYVNTHFGSEISKISKCETGNTDERLCHQMTRALSENGTTPTENRGWMSSDKILPENFHTPKSNPEERGPKILRKASGVYPERISVEKPENESLKVSEDFFTTLYEHQKQYEEELNVRKETGDIRDTSADSQQNLTKENNADAVIRSQPTTEESSQFYTRNASQEILEVQEPKDTSCLDCLWKTKTLVSWCTCMHCVDCICYHCYKDDMGSSSWFEEMMNCEGPAARNCCRWTQLGIASLMLPCIWLHPVIQGGVDLCIEYIRRNKRR